MLSRNKHAFEVGYDTSGEVVDHLELYFSDLPGASEFDLLVRMLQENGREDAARHIQARTELVPMVRRWALSPRGGFIGIKPGSLAVHKDPRIVGGTTPPGLGNAPGVDPGEMIPCLEIDGVMPRSPASRADLRAGDLILAIDGKPVPEFTDRDLHFGDGDAFDRRVRATKPRTVLTFTIRRGTTELKLPVTLAREPEKPYFGLRWLPVPWTRNGLPQGIVVEVSEVDPGSPAERAGLRSGDVIKAVDGSLTSPVTFTDQVLQHQPGEPVTLTLFPAGKSSPQDRKTVTVIPTTRPASAMAPQQ